MEDQQEKLTTYVQTSSRSEKKRFICKNHNNEVVSNRRLLSLQTCHIVHRCRRVYLLIKY